MKKGHELGSVKAATVAAQAMGWIDAQTRAVVSPLHLSTTFLRDEDNQYRSGRDYIRADNPAFDQPEAVFAALEKGADALVFSSGMAAATAVFQALAPGDHVVAPKAMYWSLRNWLNTFARDRGVETDFIDMADMEGLRRPGQPGPTKRGCAQTPANPLWSAPAARA